MRDIRTFETLLARLQALDPDLARHYQYARTDAERSACYLDLVEDVREAEARLARQQARGDAA